MNDLSLTRNQKLVLGILSETHRPKGAYDLLDELRSDGLRSPLQIYRALDKLMEYGLVHRLESLNAFVACGHPNGHAARLVAFAICENCGGVEEFFDADVQHRLGDWCRVNRFKASSTTLEIRGLCRVCSMN